MGRIRVGLIVASITLVCAASADAKQRFAAPGGIGEACTEKAPCGLKTAVGKAENEDEVIVGPGTYFVDETITSGDPLEVEALDVHGPPGGPMPKIVGTTMESSFSVFQVPGRLADLEVTLTGDDEFPVAIYCGGTIERVKVVVEADEATGVNVAGDCLLRDSSVWMRGASSTAVSGSSIFGEGTANLRNDTLIASGPQSLGVYVSYNDTMMSGSQTIDIANSIASGTTLDLQAAEDSAESPATIVASHSNFRTKKGAKVAKVIDAGGNQTAQPLFVDSGSGDFREAAGSPTIDAGAIDELIGETDLSGAPRVQGGTVDIGAYEFTPQPAPPAGGGSTGTGTTAPPPPAPSAPPKPGVLTLGAKKLTVDSKGHVSVPLTCSTAGPCAGTLALVAKNGKAPVLAGGKKKKPAAVLAKRAYSLAAGAKKTVVLILKGKALATARGKGGLAARLAVQPSSGKAQLSAITVRRGK